VRDLLPLCFLRPLSRQDAVARALDGARAASSGEAAWRRAPAHGGRRQGRDNAGAHGPLRHAYAVISGVNLSLANLTLPRVVPTRLFPRKDGAKLVWGPEIVDKAILHAEQVVDRTSALPLPFYK
jgi:hypothetical protein